MAEDMEMYLEEIIKKTNPQEYIKILEQDREDFAELCNKYEEEHKTTFEEWKKDINKITKIKENNQRIIDYGFDYDGFNNVEDLKKLIDMLVDYAKQNDKLLEEIE